MVVSLSAGRNPATRFPRATLRLVRRHDEIDGTRSTLGLLARSPVPLLALALASLIWGTADVASKLAMAAIPPVTLAALRFTIAFVVISALVARHGVRMAPTRVTAPLGFVGVALTFLLQNIGLSRTAAANASLVQGAVPGLTLLLAALLLGERLDHRRVATVGLAMAGVAAVTLPHGGGLRLPGVGDLLVLASTACFAIFIVLGRTAFPRYGTLPVLRGMTAWGAAALAPFAVVEWWMVRPGGFGMSQTALLLYLGAGCSALTYALWGYALCHLEAARAAAFDALIPVVGVVTAAIVLGDEITAWRIAGGALVILGVWQATRETKPASGERGRPALALAALD